MQSRYAAAQTARSVVVLTGAGISAESGIRTFRASDGLWEDHRIEDVASPEGFARNPQLVYNFYNQRRRQLLSPRIGPNPAHSALARFEHEILRLAGSSCWLPRM
jgi:NAD-dependent deacetylase